MATLTSASTARSTAAAPRFAAPRTAVMTKATRRERSRIALAIVTSVAALAATSGIVVLISLLPADDLEALTGLVGLLN